MSVKLEFRRQLLNSQACFLIPLAVFQLELIKTITEAFQMQNQNYVKGPI